MNGILRIGFCELVTLCTSKSGIVSGKHGVCDCRKQAPICKTYVQEADRYLKLLRDANRDLEDLRPVSQCLDNILLCLQNIFSMSKNLSSARGTTEDKQDIIASIDDLLQFYRALGTHSTSLFYEKNAVYQKLKARSYGVCCTCCIRTPISDDLGELKDALAY